MTVIDLTKHRDVRRLAELEEREKREMEEVRRALDAWTPAIEELIEAEKVHARLPRCEGPRCRERTDKIHRVQSSGGTSVLVRLCDLHLDTVRCGCLRLIAGDETDTLVWEWDVPEGVPREQIRVRRRKASRA